MNIAIGKTKVNVFQRDERGQTRKIHTGVVVAANDSFLRVFNPDSFDKGGDVTPQASQWYAVNAARSYCELAGELKSPMSLPADVMIN